MTWENTARQFVADNRSGYVVVSTVVLLGTINSHSTIFAIQPNTITHGTPSHTPTLPSGDCSPDHPRSPRPSEVTSPAAVNDIFAAFEDAYSLSAPAVMYEDAGGTSSI